MKASTLDNSAALDPQGFEPGLREALANRKAANSPWPIDPKPEPAGKRAASYDNSDGWLTVEAEKREAVISDICKTALALETEASAEHGERIKLTAIIPADMRKPEHKAALELLEFNLMIQFGGYTVEKARGGWLDGSGDFVRDSSQVYSCSFDPAKREAEAAEALLIGYFVEAGKALGEEWLHIERSTFEARHIKAS